MLFYNEGEPEKFFQAFIHTREASELRAAVFYLASAAKPETERQRTKLLQAVMVAVFVDMSNPQVAKKEVGQALGGLIEQLLLHPRVSPKALAGELLDASSGSSEPSKELFDALMSEGLVEVRAIGGQHVVVPTNAKPSVAPAQTPAGPQGPQPQRPIGQPANVGAAVRS